MTVKKLDDLTECALYWEAHVTIDPVEGDARYDVESIAKQYGFRLAKFVMRKNGEYPEDTFYTARWRGDLHVDGKKMIDFIRHLQDTGIRVRRYKIEDTVLDSNIVDELNLLA